MLVCVTDILTARFDLYVPSQLLRDQFVHRMAELCGGVTQSKAQGQWLSEHNRLCHDSVTIITVFCGRSQNKQVLEALEKEIRNLIEQGEEAVALCRDNNTMYLYGLMAGKKST